MNSEDAYSLEIELNPTFCGSVLQLVLFFFVFALVFLFIKTCK